MENNINIGDKLYHLRLADFRMADNSMQVEARITGVEIAGIHKFQNEKTRYIYMAGEAMLNGVAEDFFATEEEARAGATERINGIATRFEDHKSEEPEEEAGGPTVAKELEPKKD